MQKAIPYLRIIISSIYLFSAVNKLYFYDVFSNGVRATGIFPPGLVPYLVPAVIGIELLLGLAILMLESKFWLKLSGWAVCVPMILYNLYLIIFKGTAKCNCMISFDGKSLSNSYISIILLVGTLAGIFLIARFNNKPLFKDISNSLIAALCIVLAFIGLNLLMRNNYLADEYYILTSAPYQVLKESPVEGEVVEFFLALDGSGPEYFIHFMNNALEGTGKFPVYYVMNKYGKDANALLLDGINHRATVKILNPNNLRFEGLSNSSVWIYCKNRKVFNNNSQFVYGEMFDEILRALGIHRSQFDSEQDMQKLKELVSNISRTEDLMDGKEWIVYMLMDRHCGPCDGKYLELVKAITCDHQNAAFYPVYYLEKRVREIPEGEIRNRNEVFSLKFRQTYIGMTLIFKNVLTKKIVLQQFSPLDLSRSEMEIREILG